MQPSLSFKLFPLMVKIKQNYLLHVPPRIKIRTNLLKLEINE
jgi:hypothetical protein